MKRSGDFDLCYYNFLCAHRWGNIIYDFNHIYSNVGFCILGIIFIIIVRIKHSKLKNSDSDEEASMKTDHFVKKNDGISSPQGRKYSKSSFVNIFCGPIFPQIDKSRNCGILYHFGLYYALGIALVSI